MAPAQLYCVRTMRWTYFNYFVLKLIKLLLLCTELTYLIFLDQSISCLPCNDMLEHINLENKISVRFIYQ